MASLEVRLIHLDVSFSSYCHVTNSGAPISSVVLAVADTCYAYSYSLDEDAVDSDYSASVSFSCGHPDLDGYNVEKFFVAFDATSAQYQCSSAEIDRNDGQVSALQLFCYIGYLIC